MEQTINGLEEIKIEALNILTKNPKNKEIKADINELIGILDKSIYMLSKANESVIRDAAIKATGEIEITIDNYTFIKNDSGNKRIAIYKIDSDGMSEFIDSIELCGALDIALDSLSGMKAYVKQWYIENKNTLENEYGE